MKIAAITQTRMVICESGEDETKKAFDGKALGKEEAYIVGSDSTSRVSRYKLQLHINLPKQILILGLEARARGFVKRESKKLSIVEDLGSAITPSDIKILVQVTNRSNHKGTKQKREQEQLW